MKKVALVVDSLNSVFKNDCLKSDYLIVTKNLILQLASMRDVSLTVFTEKGNKVKLSRVNIVENSYLNSHTKYLLEVDRVVRKSGFDVVLSINMKKIYKNPLLTAHSFRYNLDNLSAFFNPFKKFFSAEKLRNEDLMFAQAPKKSQYFAVSHKIKDDYKNRFNLNPDNVHVVYPACRQVFEEYPVISKESDITFGLINKNYLAIFALGLVKLSGYNFNLKIIAKEQLNNDVILKMLVKIFSLENHVEVLCRPKSMLDFYSKINCLIFPSENEPFGLAVVEAMAVGLPCVVSSEAGAAEVIEENSGFIFEKNSLKSLSDVLKSVTMLYKNNFEQFKKYSFNSFEASKKYTWKKFAINIIDKF